MIFIYTFINITKTEIYPKGMATYFDCIQFRTERQAVMKKYIVVCNPQAYISTVYPKKYAHGFCFAVLCCDYTLTDFPTSIKLTSLALWQSNDCPSASKATLMNMDKYFMWSHYERLHNHNKAKHNKTVCIFLGIYCIHRPPSNRAEKMWWRHRGNWLTPIHHLLEKKNILRSI